MSLILGACAHDVPTPSARVSNDPITFFVGRTHGDAELHKLFSAKTSVRVDGVGRRHNGLLILDQTTREGNLAPRTRQWVMHKIAPDTYSGSLTDASGPVTIRVQGNRAHVRYPMKGGLTVRQQLVVNGDGQTMLNQMNVTKFGIPVATLRETIRKLD